MNLLMDLLSSLYFLENPWDVSPWLWVAIAVIKEASLQMMGLSVDWFFEGYTKLPTRIGEKKIPQQKPLDHRDTLYLAMNSFIESVFVCHLLYFMWYAEGIDRSLTAVGLLNGPVALWLIIVFNDMFYAPMHRALHTPFLYKWIHKHHHRVAFPQRGNVDARNEHPVEQILGMACWWASMRLSTACSGMHAVIIPLHLGMMVVFSCMNHSPFDIKMNALGIDFSVRSHEMHHRKLTSNFGQFVMFWDRVMGTYAPYVSA